MFKAYKYRIYPDREQETLIQKTFGCCRFVYNQTLAYRKKLYETEKKSVSRFDCNSYCNNVLKNDYEWLQEVDCFALTNAIFNMDAAYQKFFKEHAGYPKFKSRYASYKSYKTNYKKGSRPVDFAKGGIRLPKVGWVEARPHREITGSVKSATVSQMPSGKYFVSVLVETGHEPLPQGSLNTGSSLGLITCA